MICIHHGFSRASCQITTRLLSVRQKLLLYCYHIASSPPETASIILPDCFQSARTATVYYQIASSLPETASVYYQIATSLPETATVYYQIASSLPGAVTVYYQIASSLPEAVTILLPYYRINCISSLLPVNHYPYTMVYLFD